VSGYYQRAPEGVWRSSPERIALWAVQSTIHRIQRDIPERRDVARWQAKIQRALYEPVRKYRWEQLWHLVTKAENDPTVPVEVAAAWETVPQQIQGDDGLWRDAAITRTTREGLPFDPADMQTAFEQAGEMVKSIPDTALGRLQTIMREAYEQQNGQRGFAKAIRQEWRDVSKQKAEQIAVTEWNRAASFATYEGYEKRASRLKVWFTVGDDRVCELCEANAADGEIPIDQPFFTGDLYPPAHPGCRCNISSA
jgi:SPP1 gp7 family putative phage head morphogenesis protein